MLLLKTILISCALLNIVAEEVRYENYKVHRIIPKNKKELHWLKELENEENQFEFWSSPTDIGQPVDIMVSPKMERKFRKSTFKHGFLPKIIIDDVQSNIDHEHLTEVNDCKDTFFCSYHSIKEINNWLENVANHDKRATLLTIGKTYEGRDINGLKISFSPDNANKAIVVESTIHAREWIASSTALYLIKELLTNSNTTVRQGVEKYDWIIFPVINVDGYEFSRTTDRLWRKTRVPYQNIKETCDIAGRNFGADPNRNFDFYWGQTYDEAASNDPCSAVYAGPEPFSEPCALALKNFIDQMAKSNQLIGFITLHSYGQKMLLPYGYPENNLPEDTDNLMKIAEKASEEVYRHYNTEYTFGPLSKILYIASGTSLDWVKYVHKIPLVLGFELRDTGKYGFILPPNQIKPTGIETFYCIWKLVEEFSLNPWTFK